VILETDGVVPARSYSTARTAESRREKSSHDFVFRHIRLRPIIAAGKSAMWFKQRRARRVAAVRRQLTRLCGGESSGIDAAVPMESVECGGRGHLVSAASCLIAGYLRALQGGQPRAATRSDYLLDLLRVPVARGGTGARTTENPHAALPSATGTSLR